MSNYISEKTKWVSTSGWRGYVEPINAVAGANNTGSWSDSPCPSNVCETEITGFRKLLRKNGIRSKLKVCATSNIFCTSVYVLVHPDNKEKAIEIAENYAPDTILFYTCK
jgi:hypothetical protein